MRATCFIVPASLTTTLSASASVVEVAEVSPSIMFISVAVAVTPSKMLSSAVVTVAPSNISSSVSDISALPIVTVPAKVVLAPLNVTAVVEPDLIIRLPDVFVNEPYC